MKIAVDQRTNAIRLGRKSLSLHPTDALTSIRKRRCDFYCEICGDMQFAAVRRLSGSALPDRVRFVGFAPGKEYSYARAVDVFRRAGKLHIGVCCGYYHDEWTEPVRLKEFFRGFCRSLRRLKRVSVDVEIDKSFAYMYVDVWIEFPENKTLSACYEHVVKILRAKHRQMAESLISRTWMAMLSGNPTSGNRSRKPAAFICHDSRDKERVARPIANGLSKLKCPVWYDEFSLQVGDHLRESIEKGLKEARTCILVLSPRFLANSGWTKIEFNSIFSRELIQRKNIILPVWVRVTKEQVLRYSPSLANRFALNWSQGINEVVRKLYRAIQDRP